MVDILKVLVRAKELYINSNDDFYGMCSAIDNSFEELYPDKVTNSYSYIREIIPEFDPWFLKAPSCRGYWWPIGDHESRLEAFNKLISLYEIP